MYTVKNYDTNPYKQKVTVKEPTVREPKQRNYDKVHTYDKIRTYDKMTPYEKTMPDPKYKEYVPPWSRNKEPFQPKPKPAKEKKKIKPTRVHKSKEKPQEQKQEPVEYISPVGTIKRSLELYGLNF